MPEISDVIWVFHKSNNADEFLMDAQKHLWDHRADYFQPFDGADQDAMLILQEARHAVR